MHSNKNEKNRKYIPLQYCTCPQCGYTSSSLSLEACSEKSCPLCQTKLQPKSMGDDKIKPKIKAEQCIACAKCIHICPMGAIALVDSVAVINPVMCFGCRRCIPICPTQAIR